MRSALEARGGRCAALSITIVIDKSRRCAGVVQTAHVEASVPRACPLRFPAKIDKWGEKTSQLQPAPKRQGRAGGIPPSGPSWVPVSWRRYGAELDADVPGRWLRRTCGRGISGQKPDLSRHTARDAVRRRFRAALGRYETYVVSDAPGRGESGRLGLSAARRAEP